MFFKLKKGRALKITRKKFSSYGEMADYFRDEKFHIYLNYVLKCRDDSITEFGMCTWCNPYAKRPLDIRYGHKFLLF